MYATILSFITRIIKKIFNWNVFLNYITLIMEPKVCTVHKTTPYYIFRAFELVKAEDTPKNQIFNRPKARSGHRIVCNDSNLYCFGGFNPDLASGLRRRRIRSFLFQELWRYNFISKRWKLCFSPATEGMPEELASNAMIILGNLIILFGGTGYPFGEVRSNKCYIFDTDSDRASITQLAVEGDLPTPLYGPAIVIHKNFLYTIGGTTGFDYSCDIYRLDLNTKHWECVYICKPDVQADPYGRYRHEVVYNGKFIYVIGGGTASDVFNLKTIPAFDLEEHKWYFLDTKPDPKQDITNGFPKGRRCHSCVQYDTDNGIEAVIAGGYAESQYFSDIWKLSFPELQWKLLLTAKLPFPLYFHDAATSGNGCMYIFGGIEMGDNLRRTSDLYKIWVTVPKLSEICWEAINFYNTNLDKYSKIDLLRLGIPTTFVDRVPAA